MTCGLYGGIEVEFLKSGLTVTPYEVNTRSGERKFSYTKVDIRREDGEAITEVAKEYEPVLLTFDGTVQDRYMFHPEAVTLTNDSATLTLYDGEKILDRGTVNKHFQNTELRDVMDFIVNERQDPNDVIKGIRHPTEAVQDVEVENKGRLGLGGWFGGAADVITDVAEVFGNPEFSDTSIKFKKMTPFAALKKTASSFALQTWVDHEGYLHYGMKGTDPKSYTIGSNEEELKLKEYNVSVGSGKLAQIVLRGRYEYITNTPRGGPKQRTSPNVYSYGKAWLVDDNGNKLDGQTLEPDEEVAATSPEEVEDMARRRLTQHYMDRKNGNIILNAGASSDKAGITAMSVGDMVLASAEIQEHCKRKVDTGIFMVQSIQHQLDNRRGWLVTLGVSGLPASDIDSESWLENPENDQQWDSVDDYGPSDFDT